MVRWVDHLWINLHQRKYGSQRCSNFWETNFVEQIIERVMEISEHILIGY
jgi:hypothetical protein